MCILKKKMVVLLCWMLLVASHARSQETLLQQADRQFESQAYAKAINFYSQALVDARTTETQKTMARANTAYSYLALGDSQRAERMYRELLTEGEFSGANTIHYLNYATALANNGKMGESQQMYARYQSAAVVVSNEKAAAVMAMTNTPTSKATSYRVEYLSVNSPNAEFSPAYYRNGLVYVAGKKAVSSESVQKGYLDLFYAPDRNAIKALSVINADGSESKVQDTKNTAPRVRTPRELGADDYTVSTSNDSRTVGTFLNTKSSGISTAAGKAIAESEIFSKTLNTKYHEGPVTFSKDGSKIIFTRNNFNEGKKGTSSDNVNKLKLYTARLTANGWSNAEELPFNSEEYSVGHPALSADGQLLYFASDMPGGLGGTDLYVSEWEGTQWGKPMNLGKEINGKFDELFPFVDEQGTIYFASPNRKGGLGGLDIYFATLVSGGLKAQNVQHLNAPINSKGDDFGIITDAARTTGYFSSNRRGEGDDDIYRFMRESSLFVCRDLNLRIYDYDKKQPLDSVTIFVETRGSGQARELRTDENGRANFCLDANNDFLIRVARDGYLGNTVGFTTRQLTDDQPTRLEIPLMQPVMLMDTVLIKVDSVSNDAWDKVNPRLRRNIIRGTILSLTAPKPIEGMTVTLLNECDRVARKVITKADGRYEFDIIAGCDYTLIASKEGYGTRRDKIKRLPKTSKPKVVSTDMKMIKVGDVITVDNIYYDSGKWDLRPEAKRELDKIMGTMKRYPSLKIEIRSHTDSRGDAEVNKYLSTKRAKAVVDYFVFKGIVRTNMTATGMGESLPVNGCVDGVDCTEGEYQRNRRTEFKVLSIK